MMLRFWQMQKLFTQMTKEITKAKGDAANTAATNANAKAEIANTASQTANNAANLANEVATHPPIIIGSTWRYWNTSADAYADTGIAATPYENYLQNTTDDPVLTEAEWSVWSKEQGDFAKQGDYARNKDFGKGKYRGICPKSTRLQ